MSTKDQKNSRKFTFDMSKVRFHNCLKQTILIVWDFLRKLALWMPNPKKCANILADSNPCKQYGKFGTGFGKGSKLKDMATIFVTHFSY